MIFSNHAHVFPKEVKENGTVDALLRLMDECGIDKSVCFPCFHDRFDDIGLDVNPNVWLAEQIKGNDRLYGFGIIDFSKPDLAGQVERAADLGFKGLKLHPPYQEFKVDSPEAFQVYEKAQELDMLIVFHCGMHWHRLRDNNVLLYDEVSWNFPNLRISLEHIGGYHFFNDALAVMDNNSRHDRDVVFAGWTSITDRNGPSAWALSDEQLKTVIHQTGENRSIFGLDFPYNDAECIKSDIERIRNLDISEQCKENILGKTLAGILGVPWNN